MSTGTYQSSRLPPALSPDAFAVDDASLHDLISMSRDFAGALTFINDTGAPDGTWKKLLDGDTGALMARAMSLRLDQRKLTLLDDFAAGRSGEMAGHLLTLTTWLYDWFQSLWMAEGQFGVGASGRLEQLVLKGLGPEMTAVTRRGPVTTLQEFNDRLQEWLGAQAGQPTRWPPLRDLRRIYFALIEALERLQTAAAVEFARSLDSGTHEPAAALLMALTQAFQRVQSRINRFTGRHLDFYYRTCLGFTPLGPTPDSVHLVLERDRSFSGEVIVPAGQPFVAGQTAAGAPILFRADDPVLVTDARVAQLKTLRMERHPLISPECEFGFVNRAKAASYGATIGPMGPLGRNAAPLLGGDVLGCVADDEDARIGLAIASPVLWLKEGERLIDLTLEFDISPPDLKPKVQAPEAAEDDLESASRDPQPVAPSHGSLRAQLMTKIRRAPDAAAFSQALGDLFTAWVLCDRFSLTETDVAAIRGMPNRTHPYITDQRLGEAPPEPIDETVVQTAERKKADQDARDDLAISLAHDLLTIMLGELSPGERGPAAARSRHPERAHPAGGAPHLSPQAARRRRFKLAVKARRRRHRLNDMRNRRRNLARDVFYASAFKVEVSTASGWLELTKGGHTAKSSPAGPLAGSFSLALSLSNEDPAVVACTPKIHGAEWPTDLPVMRLTINPQCRLFPLSLYANPTLSPTLHSVALAVQVCGVKTILAYNQQGQLDPSKPFLPFGPLPNTESYLVIGSPEAAMKSISEHVLTLDWTGLPAEGFDSYYSTYGPDAGLSDAAFAVQESVLRDGRWVACGGDQQLYDLDSDGHLIGRQIILDATPLGANWRATRSPLVFDQDARSGFVKLQLTAPRQAFGHQLYPSVLTEALRPGPKGRAQAPAPNPPYTPILTRVTLDYKAETRIVMADFLTPSVDRVLHLHPFGAVQIYPGADERAHPVLPQFGNDGQLYIGVAAAALEGDLTLFFEMRQDTAVESLARDGPRPVLEWSLLGANGWSPLDARQIVADTTKGFLTSGIVKFDLPAGVARPAASLPGDQYWLRLSSESLSACFAGLQGVYAQAVRATRVIGEAPQAPLPPGTITSVSASIPGLLAISQPSTGFGLRRAEREENTRTRIGERLKHKKRAVTPWDFERLVLEQFPCVRKARCLPNTNPRTGKPSPGEVLVVIVPEPPSNDPRFATRGFQLDALELEGIEAYLPAFASPFARISVRNATYELIQVRCRVSLAPGSPVGDVLKRVNRALVNYLSPWRDGGYAAEFEWSVRSDDIEACIRSIPEVDSVAGVSLIRVWEDNSAMPKPVYRFEDTAAASDAAVAIVSASRPWSLALPLAEHFIEIMDDSSRDADAEQTLFKPEATGIADARLTAGLGLLAGLQIGETFIIGSAS